MSIIFGLSTFVVTSMISTGTRAVNGQDYAIERDFKLMNVTELMVGRRTKSPWLLIYTRSDTGNQLRNPPRRRSNARKNGHDGQTGMLRF